LILDASDAEIRHGYCFRDVAQAATDEICWQLTHMTAQVRAALRALPPAGENRSGPLGPGLLASGQLGMIIRDLQTGLALPDPD
jgi:hypothetical protein